MTSTVMQHTQTSLAGVGLRTKLQPASFPSQISLLPTIEYWRTRQRISNYDIETTRKDATLAIDACYEFDQAGLRPYVGVGYGVHFMSSEVNAPTLGLNDASDSLIKGSVAALGGIRLGLAGRLDNVFEVKYHHMPDYGQVKLNWGIAYRFTE